jgi:phosphatidylglycerophosphate synthase
MVKCAIIAAFDGAGLCPVFRVPAARRLALVAARAGLDTACVIGRDDALRPALRNIVVQDAFLTVADEGDLRRAVAGLGLDDGDQVLVMAAGSVIDAWSLKRLIAAGEGGCDLYIAGDAKEAPPSVCLVTGRSLYDVLRAFLARDGKLPTGIAFEGVPVAAGLPVVLAGGTDAKKDVKDAERLLVGALGAATARTDSFLSRHIHRPLSRPISSRLAKTAATPNMFTLFHIAVGMAGAFFLLKGTYASQVAGGLLFLASTILDGVDGELARLKLQESAFGHYLDIVGDNVVHVAVFLGITVGLYHQSHNPVYLGALALLLVGFGLCALSVQFFMGHGPGEQASGQTHWLASLVVNRDFAYLVAFLALINRLSWFVFGTTVGAYLFALVLFILGRKRRSRGKAALAPDGT